MIASIGRHGTALNTWTITRTFRVAIAIALTIVWIAPVSAQVEPREAKHGELIIIRLHDGREVVGEVASMLKDDGFFIKIPDELVPRFIKIEDISAMRSATGGAPLKPPPPQRVKRSGKISTPNKVLIAVGATLAGILLFAYLANPRD